MDINKFCTHVQAEGFVLYPQNVKADGRWHNCRLADNAKGKAAGAYKILNASVALYKNWRDGECKYYSDNTIVNKYGQDTLKKLIKKQEMELKQQYFEASKAAYDKYMTISNTHEENCPYLLKKQIGNYGCKVDKSGDLIIPYYNEHGYLRTLQTIKPSGFKIYEEGAELQGNYHKIGFSLVDKVNDKYFGKIFIGEGYSTMASVHEATKCPCVVSAQSTNLPKVTEKIAKLYPKAQLFICADNDLYLRETIPNNGKWIWDNPGVQAAIKASQKVDCKIIFPDFSHLPDGHGFTDFNDLHCHSGIGAVKHQIIQGIMQLKTFSKKIQAPSLDTSTDIFLTNSEAIINPVNCVGVMGKGLALEFKNRYPENFKAYEKACKLGMVETGKMFLYENNKDYNPNHKTILNFPTKKHWRDRSELSYIESGLEDLVKVIRAHNIKSVAMPPIGCGLGGLDWKVVRLMIEQKFSSLPDVKLQIYDPIKPSTHTTRTKQRQTHTASYEMSL